LRAAVELGASQNFTSLSGYIRIALLSQLKSDGIEPARPLCRPAASSAAPAAAVAERHATA
jgi:hypothetical protein